MGRSVRIQGPRTKSILCASDPVARRLDRVVAEGHECWSEAVVLRTIAGRPKRASNPLDGLVVTMRDTRGKEGRCHATEVKNRLASSTGY